jgi:hypothetical protein
MRPPVTTIDRRLLVRLGSTLPCFASVDEPSLATLRWADFERQTPRLAGVAHDRLIAPGVLLVVTIRRDGTARLSPVEPLVLDGDLWLSMMWQSRKATDLLRDDRLLVHSIITTRDGDEGEVKLRVVPCPLAIQNPEPGTATRSRFSGGVRKSRTSISFASRSQTSLLSATHQPETNTSRTGPPGRSSCADRRHRPAWEQKSRCMISFVPNSVR